MAYTGSFIDWQGVRFLADNAENLLKQYKNLFILMLGNGKEYEYVSNRMKESEFAGRYLVHPGVSKQEINAILPLIDIVIIPREKNLCTNTAVPLKAIEAMKAGKCILASNDNGLTELLNVENAKLFEAFDADSLMQNLGSLVDDKELRERLGQRAFSDASKCLNSWEENVYELNKAYMNVLKEK